MNMQLIYVLATAVNASGEFLAIEKNTFTHVTHFNYVIAISKQKLNIIALRNLAFYQIFSAYTSKN